MSPVEISQSSIPVMRFEVTKSMVSCRNTFSDGSIEDLENPEVRVLLELQEKMGLSMEGWLERLRELAGELVSCRGEEAAQQLINETLVEKIKRDTWRMQKQHEKLQYLNEVISMLDYSEQQALTQLEYLLPPLCAKEVKL